MPTTTTDYTLFTWADSFNRWNCRIDFTEGAGNTGEGERLIASAKTAARRAIRKEIAMRNSLAVGLGYKPKFEIVANRENPSTGALMSLTIAEK